MGDSASGQLVSDLDLTVLQPPSDLRSLQYVSCPLHKRNFTLVDGDCLNDSEYQILTFDAREDPSGTGDVEVLLPPEHDIDAILGTEKWLLRQAQSEALGLNADAKIEIVVPSNAGPELAEGGMDNCGGGCGDSKLSW